MKAARILLVDDFEDARDMYMTYLTYEGYEVITAATAAEALVLSATARPDLILMDAGLPGLTGWDAIAELKRDPLTKEIPVLMLTGHVLQESQDRAAEAGADGFIPKPCLPDELARQIRIALKRRVTGRKPVEQRKRRRLSR
jgi:DNA-binding response OmpR family regulator